MDKDKINSRFGCARNLAESVCLSEICVFNYIKWLTLESNED